MAAFGRNQSVGLGGLGTRCFEKHELRLGFGVFGLKGTRVTQDNGTNFLQHSHRADISRPHVQDHDLFRGNT